jgi:DNA-binding CsgD family transcriptional regulator
MTKTPLFRRPVWAILGYALVLGAGIALIHTLEARWLVISPNWPFYSLAIAIIFLLLGIWLARQLNAPQAPDVRIPTADPGKAATLGLSSRELEVLEGMAAGLSNAEIGEKLFLSTHTVKSHASKLFEKMDVKRRTQAIQKGKEMGILS